MMCFPAFWSTKVVPKKRPGPKRRARASIHVRLQRCVARLQRSLLDTGAQHALRLLQLGVVEHLVNEICLMNFGDLDWQKLYESIDVRLLYTIIYTLYIYVFLLSYLMYLMDMDDV